MYWDGGCGVFALSSWLHVEDQAAWDRMEDGHPGKVSAVWRMLYGTERR